MRRSALHRRLDAVPGLRRLPAPAIALIAISLAALVARLWDLGWRVAHQDEGRVADWIIHYIDSGFWQYKPIIHGPFLPHVNGILFPIVGANDFTMRLVVAVLGALLPLSAWLLRSRLRDSEVVALGAFLALNPILIYYSRFMRSDLPLVVFAMFAFAFAVRAIDTRRPIHLHAAALSMGLAMTTKENALLYFMAWAGALAIVLDTRLVIGAARDDDADGDADAGDAATGPGSGGTAALDGGTSRSRLPAWLGQGAPGRLRALFAPIVRGLWAWRLHVVLAFAQFAVVVVLFYAPLPDLWQAFGNPTMFPGVIEEATLGSWEEFRGQWGHTDRGEEAFTDLGRYTDFAEFHLDVLEVAALPLCAFALLGFLYARYADGDRPLVAVCTYWGVASVFGYSLVMDIQAAWALTHVVAPLAVPAAVGAGIFVRKLAALSASDRIDALLVAVLVAAGVLALAEFRDGGVDAALAGDPSALLAGGALLAIAAAGAFVASGGPDRGPSAAQIAAGVGTAALVLAALQAGTFAYDTSFENPQSPDNPLVQYAQPSGEMQPTLAQIYDHAETTDGVVLGYYGDESGRYCNQLVQPTEEWTPPGPDIPPCGWFSRLPLPWYTSAHDVTTGSFSNASDLLDDPPPAVIALGDSISDSPDDNTAGDLEALTDRGYERYEHEGYLWGRPLIFFVEES